jgi:chemotaxis protein MotB
VRKQNIKKEDEEQLDRWLISYADFLTLIFTFFAALYALSTLDKEKAGQFTTSLNLAFNVINKPISNKFEHQKEIQSDIAGKVSDIEGVTIKSDPRGVVITLSNDTAFVSGSSDIKDPMVRALNGIAEVLKKTPGRIVIEGNTDNIALTGTKYKSNWELATSRAASVLHVFIQQGIDPARFIIAGYGEYRPIASNETAEGRAKNRRVEIVFAPASLN